VVKITLELFFLFMTTCVNDENISIETVFIVLQNVLFHNHFRLIHENGISSNMSRNIIKNSSARERSRDNYYSNCCVFLQFFVRIKYDLVGV
jgi:hypothetical protein